MYNMLCKYAYSLIKIYSPLFIILPPPPPSCSYCCCCITITSSSQQRKSTRSFLLLLLLLLLHPPLPPLSHIYTSSSSIPLIIHTQATAPQPGTLPTHSPTPTPSASASVCVCVCVYSSSPPLLSHRQSAQSWPGTNSILARICRCPPRIESRSLHGHKVKRPLLPALVVCRSRRGRSVLLVGGGCAIVGVCVWICLYLRI